MGIPSSAFRAGDLYIEYAFENVLFRYEKQSGRFYSKFYGDIFESERPHNDKLLCDATLSGVLTTKERYSNGGAPPADPSAGNFKRVAVMFQRTRPYWLSVMQGKDYSRCGDIEVGLDGRLELVKAADSVQGQLEAIVAEINAQPSLVVTRADVASITVDRQSSELDLALRLELKRREWAVYAESSWYRGRSAS